MLTRIVKNQLKALPSFKKVIVGVSGGADSVALAHILIQLGYQITIAHLNHGLRGKESNGDERFVKNLSALWGVPFVTRNIHVPKKGNLENNARLARYLFLETIRRQKKARFIAVAHHQDDQIETILLHLQRGAGVRGLCGMTLQSGAVIRPLLHVTKQQLTDYLKKQKIDYRMDSSNADLTFQRNYLRHIIIPALKKQNRHFENKILALSASAQKQLASLEKKAARWIKQCVTNDGFERLEFLKLTDDLQAEVLFSLCGSRDIYRPSVDKVKKLILKGVTGKQQTISRYTFYIQYSRVAYCEGFISKADLPKIKLTTREIRWGNWKMSYKGKLTLFARPWQPGDRFRPAGMRGAKKLQDFFVDQKIPQPERHSIPVIVDQKNCVLGVGNLRVAHNALCLKQYLQINKIGCDLPG